MNKVLLGASLSTKQCNQLAIDSLDLLKSSMQELGLRRFRLMSYWDECEPEQGEYHFDHLDKLITHITNNGGEISLCLGVRQPRWPECHAPQWAKDLPQNKRKTALLAFIKTVVKRYKDNTTIVSWQLENEAYNRGIGECEDYSRERIVREFESIKHTDPFRPIVMTTSNTWTIPFRAPRPDSIGVSLYRHQWTKHGLTKRHLPALYHKIRGWIMRELLQVDVFCHELQMEPWGPRATQDLPDKQQKSLLPVKMLAVHLRYAIATGNSTIDMWGLEWWYWRKVQCNDPSYWNQMKKLIARYNS